MKAEKREITYAEILDDLFFDETMIKKDTLFDTYVYKFWEWLASKDLKAECNDVDLKRLIEQLNGVYAYGQLQTKKFTREQAFLLGGIWGAIGLMKALNNEQI